MSCSMNGVTERSMVPALPFLKEPIQPAAKMQSTAAAALEIAME